MQQWSKEFIEKSIDIHQFRYRYIQSAYCFYNFNHHLIQPAAFEVCKLKILQEKDYSITMSLTDVLCDDFNWCKRLPVARPWNLFRSAIDKMHKASVNDKLFKIYGGY